MQKKHIVGLAGKFQFVETEELEFVEVNMGNIQILNLFFKAENERDWISYKKFLSPHIVWELHSERLNCKTRCNPSRSGLRP